MRQQVFCGLVLLSLLGTVVPAWSQGPIIPIPNSQAKTEAEMKEYTQKIRNTEVSFKMVPIPGGEFMMGSPNSEANRNDDEGPQHKVKIEPFWMGKTEVTWDEYEIFMFPSLEKATNVSTERIKTTASSGRHCANSFTTYSPRRRATRASRFAWDRASSARIPPVPCSVPMAAEDAPTL